MIIKGFVEIVYLFILGVTAPFRLLPDVAVSSGFSDSITNAGTYGMSLDHFFPVHELFLIITGTFIVFEVAVLAWKFMNWVIRKIPGIS